MMTLYTSSQILRQIVAFALLSSFTCCYGWVSQTSQALNTGYGISIANTSFESKSISDLSCSQNNNRLRSALASSTSSTESLAVASNDDEEDDDDEYEYVEYDILTEDEFMGSEWLVGTVMDGREDNIKETWVRLATDKDGKNVAIWGDNAEGNWNFDTASQFLSMSKNAIWGKNIWAGVVDDFYFSRGTVRGWNFFSAASVVGQWQAKRLGVEPGEAGVAPWFEPAEEERESPALTESETTTEDNL